MPSVSIIVPIYKIKEGYLRECINSLINQTLSDIEIILVDDGSPDDCGKICDEYAAVDARIRVIHQENQGVSVARNVGIDAATGKWLTFVDADDWLEPDACEKSVEVAESLNVDVLHFAGYKNLVNNVEEIHYDLPKGYLLKEDNKRDLIRNLLNPFTIVPMATVWCTLFRLNTLKRSKIIFPAGYPLGEDQIFQLELALTLAIEKMAYMDSCLYHYRARNSSVCLQYRADRAMHSKMFIEKIHELFSENGLLEDTVLCQLFYTMAVSSFQEILFKHIWHTDYSIPYKQRVKESTELSRDIIFDEALQNLKAEKLRLKKRISLFLIRKRMYVIFIILKRICAIRLSTRKAFE